MSRRDGRRPGHAAVVGVEDPASGAHGEALIDGGAGHRPQVDCGVQCANRPYRSPVGGQRDETVPAHGHAPHPMTVDAVHRCEGIEDGEWDRYGCPGRPVVRSQILCRGAGDGCADINGAAPDPIENSGSGKRPAPSGTAVRRRRTVSPSPTASQRSWLEQATALNGRVIPVFSRFHTMPPSRVSKTVPASPTATSASGRTGDAVEVMVGRNLDRRPRSAGRAAHVDSTPAADGDGVEGVGQATESSAAGGPTEEEDLSPRAAVDAAGHTTRDEKKADDDAPWARKHRTH